MLVVTCGASHIVQLQSVGGVGAMSGPVICTLEAAPTGLEPDLSLDSQSQAEEIVTVSWAPDFHITGRGNKI